MSDEQSPLGPYDRGRLTMTRRLLFRAHETITRAEVLRNEKDVALKCLLAFLDAMEAARCANVVYHRIMERIDDEND